MPPKKKKVQPKYKIVRDRRGNRFVLLKNKRISVPSNITDVEFIKWLIKYLKPKRRTARKVKKESPYLGHLIKPDLTNPDVLAYTNVERKHAGLSMLKMGDKPGKLTFAPPDAIANHRAEPLALSGPAARRALQSPVAYQPIEEEYEGDEEEPELGEHKPEKEGKKSERLHPATEVELTGILDRSVRTKEAEKESKRARDEAAAAREKHAESQEKLLKSAVKNTENYLVKRDSPYSRDYLISMAATSDSDMKYVKTEKYATKTWLVNWLLENEVPVFMDLWRAKLNEFIGSEPQVGTGAMARDGMTTDQINEMLEALKPHFLGTISRNGWDQLTPAAHSGKSAWVMNTDKTGKPGMHWVAFLIDLDDKSVEYYDSFAGDLPMDVDASLVEFIKHNAIKDQYLKLKINGIIDQAATTDNCGWFCCKFIIDRFRGKKWREATRFDEHVKGEEAIAAFKKKYPYDRYI